MNLIDSIHGRVDPTTIPMLDAKAAAEGRPTTPIYKIIKQDKIKKVEQAK
jgi:hypothetical protein